MGIRRRPGPARGRRGLACFRCASTGIPGNPWFCQGKAPTLDGPPVGCAPPLPLPWAEAFQGPRPQTLTVAADEGGRGQAVA